MRITGTSHEDISTFGIISCQIILRMNNVSDIESGSTLFMFSKFFLKIVSFMR